MGLGARLHGNGKFLLHQSSIPDRPARSESLYRYGITAANLCFILAVKGKGIGNNAVDTIFKCPTVGITSLFCPHSYS